MAQVRGGVYVAARAALETVHGAAGGKLAVAAAGRLDMWGHNMMQEQGAFGADASDGEGRD